MKSDILTSESFGTAAALAISQGLPPIIGRPMAAFLSWVLGNRLVSPTYRAIQSNQWVIHDGKLSRKELRHAVRKVYQHQGRALYDYYRNLDRPAEIARLVKLTPKFAALVEDCKKQETATMLLMPHLSGFNLGGLYLEQIGFHFLTLAIPNPAKGYAWQNKIRNDRGMEVVPMSISSMQTARERLQNGGTVLTGIDRPHPESGYTPNFFGRPAVLPVAYVRLALHTKARVFVVGFRTLPDHSYLIDVSDEIPLEEIHDPRQELQLNAEKILRVAESFIRLDPDQWMMFLPVWPDVEQELKGF